MLVGQLLSNAIAVGAIYAIVTIGFGLLYRTTGVFHVAYGGIFVLSAYAVVWAKGSLGLPLAPAVLAGLAMASLAGLALETFVYEPLRARGATAGAGLIASLGVFILIENVLALLFGNEVRRISSGVEPAALMNPVRLTRIQVLQILVAAVLLIAFGALTRSDRHFRALWALGDIPELIPALGLPVRVLRGLAVMTSSSCAAIAAALTTWEVGIEPHAGMRPVLAGAVAVFAGGVDRYWGWVCGAFVLAVLQSLAILSFSAAWVDLVTFALLVATLLLRPQGILGTRRRFEEGP